MLLKNLKFSVQVKWRIDISVFLLYRMSTNSFATVVYSKGITASDVTFGAEQQYSL